MLAATALLVGCGGGGISIYKKDATEACLRKAALQPRPVSESVDFVASSAKGGAFVVQLVDNRVTVSFGDTIDNADNIELAYRRFKAANVGLDDVLRRQGNALMLWHVHPQDNDLTTIAGCLKN